MKKPICKNDMIKTPGTHLIKRFTRHFVPAGDIKFKGSYAFCL
ncbi:hypothetical protein CEV31_1175 [Brucella thiophenivorans]|uniref:Uncharacterized protein n=1 Tax=Brucella thiophenivorans TaxID=571255 RepID=A0A256FY32_9HYPH|nr:hypothetical protein CEV31_1175 [Brucella thiophenivorans]